MVNSILQLSTPALAWSAVTAIPIIEPALRSILLFGELLLNRGDYYSSKIKFVPLHPFTNDQNYPSVGQKFKATLQKEINDFNLKLTTARLTEKPLTENKFALQDGNSKDFFFVDIEIFKFFSGTYKSACEDFGENVTLDLVDSQDNPIVHSKTPGFKDGEQVKGFVIPSEIGDKNSFKLLENYLNGHPVNFTTLDKKTLLNLQALAAYLNITSLEKQITLLIVEDILSRGLTSIDEYKGLINLECYSKEFNQLFDDIKEFKESHRLQYLNYRLNNLDYNKWNIIENLAINILVAVLLTPIPFYPFIIPLRNERAVEAAIYYPLIPLVIAAGNGCLDVTGRIIVKSEDFIKIGLNAVINTALKVFEAVKFVFETIIRTVLNGIGFVLLNTPAPIIAGVACAILMTA